MYEVLSNMEYNQIIFQLAEIFKDEANSETMIMLAYLVRYDLYFIEKCETSEDLEEQVISSAKIQGEYAGMYYEASDFLDPDDDNFSAPDDGLSWIAFGDAWEALKKVAINNQ